MKVHLRDLRLFVNAGLDFPSCQSRAELLDLDKGRWPTSPDKSSVTCKKCRRIAKRSER